MLVRLPQADHAPFPSNLPLILIYYWPSVFLRSFRVWRSAGRKFSRNDSGNRQYSPRIGEQRSNDWGVGIKLEGIDRDQLRLRLHCRRSASNKFDLGTVNKVYFIDSRRKERIHSPPWQPQIDLCFVERTAIQRRSLEGSKRSGVTRTAGKIRFALLARLYAARI